MQWYEIMIVIFAALFVVGVIVWQIIRKKQGKGGCDCGSCSHCAGCSACRTKEAKPKDPAANENQHTQSP